MPTPTAPCDDRDRGSITVWTAVTGLALIVMMGFALDGGRLIRARERAQDIAGQAARAGAQQIDGAAAIQGLDVSLDPTAAVAASQTYLAGVADVTGTVQVTGATVTVETTTTASTAILGIIGIDSITVHGHGQATVDRAVGGVAR